MAASIHVRNGVGRIAMSGRFDFQVHREFKDAYTTLFDKPEVSEIEVELSHVDYLDSSALGMLMLLNERAKAGGKSVVLLNASDVVAQVLEVANFGKIFTIRRAA